MRDWDFCDKCMFYICCSRAERRKGDGCRVFEAYPWEVK